MAPSDCGVVRNASIAGTNRRREMASPQPDVECILIRFLIGIFGRMKAVCVQG